jgi:hypothetical protein
VLAVKDVADVYASLMSLDSVLKAVYQPLNRKLKHIAVWELFTKTHGVTATSFPSFVQTE